MHAQEGHPENASLQAELDADIPHERGQPGGTVHDWNIGQIAHGPDDLGRIVRTGRARRTGLTWCAAGTVMAIHPVGPRLALLSLRPGLAPDSPVERTFLKGTPHPNPLPVKKCGERERHV